MDILSISFLVLHFTLSHHFGSFYIDRSIWTPNLSLPRVLLIGRVQRDIKVRYTLDSKLKFWILMILTMMVPGSGYVFLGKAMRGLMMLMWMFVFAFITYHLTDDSISFVGRMSGGFAVWTLSIMEVYRFGKKRLKIEVL